MKTSAIRIGAAAGVVLAVCGCRETTPSDYVSTGRITALVDFTAESADSSTARVELRMGGAESETYVVLHSGDTLVASVAGETRDLRPQAEGVYEATFGTGDEVELVVELDREKFEDAPATVATLPEPFELVTPAVGAKLSRAKDALAITWSPAVSASGRAELSGPCVAPVSFEVSAGAMGVTIEEGELPASDEGAGDTCAVELTVTITRTGQVDEALHGESVARGHQVRRVSFVSAP